MEEIYTLTQDIKNNYINGIVIPQEATDEIEWGIRDRDDFLQELSYTMIPEAYHAGKTSDLALMEEDQEYLRKYDDVLMLDSQSTNAYLLPSEEGDREEFNSVCKQLLEFTKKMEEKGD